MLQHPHYVGSGNDHFICGHCGAEVPPATNGSFRNHCPYCLWSRHMDVAPGDRASDCRGLMAPMALDYHSRKGYQIIHQCTACGAMRRNRLVDSGLAPDDPGEIRRLSASPWSA